MIEEIEPAQCPNVDLVVFDQDLARIALAVDDWNATTLLACVSEDPADWSQIAAVWSRYKVGPSANELEELEFKVVDFDAAITHLSEQRAWVVIDLRSKRICTGKVNDPMERDGCYVMNEENEDGDETSQELRILVHFPPWWEFHHHVELSIVGQPRHQAVIVFQPQREILWGPELAKGLAERMLRRLELDNELSEILSSLSSDFSAPTDAEPTDKESTDEDPTDEETAKHGNGLRKELHKRTVAVHRDWLMTPRDDLNGRMPRQCLHGGMKWIGLVVEGQQWQALPNRPLVPLPDAMAMDHRVPMGGSEVCMYFDLCRELISAGWLRVGLRSDSNTCVTAEELAVHLAEMQKSWMRMPYEGGASPQAIILAERYRLPRMTNPDHSGILDCDCPICEMIAAGGFETGNIGPSFEGIDGYHLELDDEFAFSMHETREEWENHRCNYEEENFTESESTNDASCDDMDDEFGSVWKSTYISPQGIPGDRNGHLAIGFLLADMVDALKRKGAQNEVDELNQAFREYRGAGQYELAIATGQFQDVLEQVAQRHSDLVGRSADLQNRLDELMRWSEEIDSDDD